MRVAAALVLVAAPLFAQEAAEPAHPVESLRLDDHIAWIDDGAVFHDQRAAKRSLTDEEAAVDRGALLDGAIARAKEEGKLVLWHVPRIIEDEARGRQMYRAPVLDLYCRQVFFCDEDVTALVEASYVPLRMVYDEAMAQRFGERPLGFVEPAFLFLDGDGNVVHTLERIRTFSAEWFFRVAGQVAARERPRDAELDDDAGLFLDEGDAGATLGDIEDLYDIDLDGPEGDLFNGELAVRRGDLQAALEPLERAWRAGNAEAGYLSGWCRARLGDVAGAQTRFQLVATRYPDSLAGKRAAANVALGLDERPMGATFAGYEHIGPLRGASFDPLPRDTTWTAERPSVEELTRGALTFLIGQQRDHGGFTDARYAYWPTSEITENTWVAITALCCAALAEYRDAFPDDVDPAAIDLALGLGETYLFDAKRMRRGKNEDVYADAFRLGYLTRRIALEPEWATPFVERIEGVLSEALPRQSESGFFRHEYDNAFCTAAMLWSLLEARDAGAEVPEDVMTRAAAALASARYENGAYSYGGAAREGREGSLKDSSGRMPMCEGVLLRMGESNPARLELAFDTFVEYVERLERVRRNDFHSDGELAGFFFWHDVYHASEALELLPEARRGEMRERLLELVHAVPEMDGSFVDSHEFGKSYATAMALLTLRNLAGE